MFYVFSKWDLSVIIPMTYKIKFGLDAVKNYNMCVIIIFNDGNLIWRFYKKKRVKLNWTVWKN